MPEAIAPVAIAPVVAAPVVPVVIPVVREAPPATPEPAPPLTLNTIWPASSGKENLHSHNLQEC